MSNGRTIGKIEPFMTKHTVEHDGEKRAGIICLNAHIEDGDDLDEERTFTFRSPYSGDLNDIFLTPRMNTKTREP